MDPSVKVATVLLVLCTACALTRALQLELASVVFRHGDRSPVGTFPNDLYPNYWPQGFGQLSKRGMEQEYNLGKLLQKRYINETGFLARNYTRNQIYVRSTDVDRTLMSAESLLAALYPPDEEERFVPDLPWQPIPVHTVPTSEDALLRAYDVNCPKYKKLREADTHSAEYMRVEQENKDFFRRLEQLSGYDVVDLSNIWSLEDVIFVEHTTGLPLPGWNLPSDLERMKVLSDFTLALMFNSKEKHRLTAGIWLQKVLSDMVGKATGNQTLADKKVFLYSAHDTTVACMMSALGVYNGLQPSYASAFFVELYSDDSGNYFVQLSFHNETDSDQVLVLSVSSDICNNPSLCTLQEFQWLVEPLIPSDWEEECELPSLCDNAVVLVLAVLFAVSGTILIICSVILACMCFRRRKTKYKTLMQDAQLSFAESKEPIPDLEPSV